MIKLNIFRFLLILLYFVQSFKKIKSDLDFKCVTDGLFEDENDCEAYYECMWIGTAFEKQEHNRCADKLIYNPKKHRCDNVYDFESQFSKGIQTGEELLEFMRYRNCIESKNIIINSTQKPNININISSEYTTNTINKEKIEPEINEISNSSSFITVEILSNTLNENLKTENLSLKNDESLKMDDKLTKDVYTRSDNENSIKGFAILAPKNTNRFRNTLEKKKDRVRYKINLKKTFLDSNLELLSSKKNKSATNGESVKAFKPIISDTSNIQTQTAFITHRRRRLLSLDNLYETTIYDETTEDDITPTTLLDDEIDSTDEVYHDKDEIVHNFSNKVMSKLENNTENVDKKRIIDSIEETLSKRLNSNASTEFLQTNDVSLEKDIYSDNNFSIPLVQTNYTTTTKVVQNDTTNQNISSKSNFTFFNPFKRPLKFLKMLPKINLSPDNKTKSNDLLGEILNITSRLINEINSTEIPQTTEIDHQLEYEETDIEGVRGHKIKKMSTQITKRTTEMETHYTTFFPHKTETTTKTPLNMTTLLSVDQTKPTMQTYKINPNKKLPNQFASLRLNYDQDSLVTKIDEIERGGKFQRLRLVPADTLIECKENDFGLECSCSITLSPPKCKQLINSFLSSCRILGCKNNGKCINMAFKYPIPYVCSCPSDFMGSYCEMPRNLEVENDLNEVNTSRSTTEKSILKNINVVTTKTQITTRMPITQRTTKEFTTKKQELKIEQFKDINSFTEPLCNPNPCMNNAKCYVANNKFLCICSNASYTGRYCENFHNTIKLTETTNYKVSNILPKIEEFTTKFVFSQTSKRPYYFTTTPRAYIWQCPSNCFYNFGRGYCTLSASGTPHCVCRLEWTGVDCSQKNYCLTSRCEHNSTCSNYPEMKSYLCICPQGYSGRFCEIPTMAPLISQNLPVAIAQKLLSNIEIKPSNDSKKFLSLPIKNPCEEEKTKCKNNSTCLMSFSHAKNKFGFICICNEGFSGQFCENKIDFKNLSTETQTMTSKLTPNKPKPKSKTMIDYENPCKLDPDICKRNPLGNDSYTCVKSFLTQDYTLCLSTKSLNCKESNPCLNGGYCIQEESDDDSKSSWRCECSSEFTGRLCETEICTGVHRLFSNHTMCRPDSPNLTFGGINSSDIELIIEMHNNLRRQVTPSAANMQQVYWDVRLQHLAQKRAQLCSVENTGILMRQQPGYGVVIGENLAAGYEKWSHVLTSWMGEKKNFIYKSSSSSDNLQSGHYTQMIYSSAARIGCGYAMCSNSTYERYFVCFYGEMQTYHSRYEPYQEGQSCSACEKNCNNGLCDCKGAYCLNGGTMDLNTCTCTCPYSTFSGKYCENVICPKEDSPFCSQSMFEDKCWLYPVVRATCPYMCSLCTKNSIKNASNFTINSTQVQRLFKNEGSYFN